MHVPIQINMGLKTIDQVDRGLATTMIQPTYGKIIYPRSRSQNWELSSINYEEIII